MKLEDVFAARIQAQFTSSHRNDSGVATTSNQLTLTEVTLYPISGSFGASGCHTCGQRRATPPRVPVTIAS